MRCSSYLALMVLIGPAAASAQSICNPCVDPPLRPDLIPERQAILDSQRAEAFRRAVREFRRRQEEARESVAPTDASEGTVEEPNDAPAEPETEDE